MDAMKYLSAMVLLVCFALYIENQPDSHPLFQGMKRAGGWVVETLDQNGGAMFIIPIDHPTTDALIDALIDSGDIPSH